MTPVIADYSLLEILIEKEITEMNLDIDRVIDPFHIVISLSNRSSIEKPIKLILKMKGQIAY